MRCPSPSRSPRRRAALPAWAAALFLAAPCCAAGADDAAPDVSKLRGQVRLTGPKYQHDDRAVFSVRAPLAAKETPLLLTAAAPDGKTADAPVRLEPPSGRRGGTTASAEVAVNVAGWPDGECTARLVFGVPAGGRGAASKPASAPAVLASWPFRIIRRKLHALLPEGVREEFAVWLDHVNRFADNKRVMSQWEGVDRVLAKAAQYDRLRGVVLRSYYNPQLDRLQPYSVYVPKAYDPARPMALMILLHGSGYDYMNLLADMKAGQEFETHPMLVANAGAFRYQEFRHMALNDVLWVLADMQRKYNVDADCVCLQGISLGGRGALEIAALRPDLFAAASPQGVYGTMQETSDPAFFARQQPYGRWMAARWDIRSYLPNVRHVPMQILFGWKDTTTPPLNALTFRHLINKRFGGRAQAIGFDTGHNISLPHYKWADTRKWFCEQRRAKDPHVVTARTATLRFNRFYWVTIDQMQQHWQMAEVSARLSEESGALWVRTENIAALTLQPPAPWSVLVVDDQEVELPQAATATRGRKICLARSPAGTWRPAKAAASAPAGPRKRHGLSGPIWDVLHGRCLSVYGTGGTPDETLAARRLARSIARLDAAWGTPSLPVLADRDVTEEQKKTCNLLLVGDARTNRLIAGQAWPFDLAAVGRGKGIRIFGRTYDEPNDVLHFIYPSPYGRDTYVYVVAPARAQEATPAAMGPNASWTTEVWTDWLVRRYEPVAGRPERGPTRRRVVPVPVAAGTFDAAWKLVPTDGELFRCRPMNWE